MHKAGQNAAVAAVCTDAEDAHRRAAVRVPETSGNARHSEERRAPAYLHRYRKCALRVSALGIVYLLMITNKASNIVEDLATLRLFSKVVPEFCAGMISEETILKNAFEIIFAFDEVLSLGYRENITLQQIRTNLEMDSHEEKLHDMIQQSKEQEGCSSCQRGCGAAEGAQGT